MGGKEVNPRYKHIILLLTLVISLSTVSIAQLNIISDFDISINTTKAEIYEDEIAEYQLIITNNGIFEEAFLPPFTSDPDWIITTDPLVTKIGPKETVNYKLFVDPKTTVIPGQYGVILNVRSSLTDTNEKVLFLIFIKPLNPLPLGYVSSIALNVELPTEIDPRSSVPISIYMRNRNARTYTNLTIKFESKLITNNYYLPFNALEERTEKFSYKLSEYEPPQEDTLLVTLLDEDEVINQIRVPIRIVPYSEIKEEVDTVSKFLKKTSYITIVNYGNTKNINPYKYKVGFFEKIVTSSEPDSYSSKENGQRYINFPVSLEPRQEMDIEIVTNHRLIVYTILLIIAGIVLYYQVRSPVVSKKEALTSEPQHDGVSEFKIRLLIKNRSQKPVENVKVIESIPSLAKLIKESTVGTLQPTKVIKHDKRGIIIRYDINYLEPFEERIITYKIKSKLNIVGALTLPATKIKYENIRGRERVTYSRKHKIKIYS